MNGLKNNLLIAAGFTVLIAVVGGISAGPAIALAVKAALVKNVDEPGRSPYQSHSICVGTGDCRSNFVGIPQNTRLVVQSVTIYVHNDGAPADNPGVFLRDEAGSRAFAHFAVQKINSRDWAISQPVTAFMSGDQAPQLYVFQSGAFTASAELAGYLVDLNQ